MKKLNLLFALLLVVNGIFAQAKTQNYDYKNFDKLNLIGFNDDINIEVGKAFEIEITTNEESKKYLKFTYKESENELTIKVDNSENSNKNWDYKNQGKYKIKIAMPEISVLTNLGNGDVNINGILGRYFRVKTTGNGDIICKGTIDELEVEKTGNGDVNAKNLMAKNAKIASTGNGNVSLNVTEKLTAKNTGNGDVLNYGKATFDSNSKNVGNGELLKR
jgi:ribosomal protein L9